MRITSLCTGDEWAPRAVVQRPHGKNNNDDSLGSRLIFLRQSSIEAVFGILIK